MVSVPPYCAATEAGAAVEGAGAELEGAGATAETDGLAEVLGATVLAVVEGAGVAEAAGVEGDELQPARIKHNTVMTARDVNKILLRILTSELFFCLWVFEEKIGKKSIIFL
jgi:hypothetical protein